MNKLKRLAGIILSLSLIFQTISAVAADSAATEQRYGAELNMLKSLGIYTPAGLADESVTQEEFMKLTAKIFGKAFDMKYFDSLGILPFSTGKYNPQKEVTYADAVRAMVIVTGYDYYAKSDDGFPNGYIKTADSVGITKGVSVENESAITAAELAKLAANTLTVDVLGVSNIVGGSVEYAVKDGENLLKNTFDIYEIKGIVERTPEISITESVEPKAGYAVIDGVEYIVGGIDIESLAGMAVEGYYKEDGEDDFGTLLYLTETKKNIVAEVFGDDIISYEERKYTYEAPATDKTAKLSEECDIIYNYSRVEPTSELKIPMIPENGNIKLIDNDGDGKTDVLFIYDYETYLVDYVNLSKYSIGTKYDKGSVEIGEDNDDVTIILNNKTISISDIKSNDVLNVLENIEKTKKRIIVTRDVVSGTVNGKAEEDGKIELELADGTEYVFISELTDKASEIKLAASVSLYLDINKKVSGFAITGNSDMKLAYLVDIQNTDEELDGKVYFVMYDLDNSEKVGFYSAKKVKIDDVTCKQESVKDVLPEENGAFKARLIRYKLNADSEVKEIDTYTDNGNSLRKNSDSGLLRLYYSPVKNFQTGGLQGYYYKEGHFIKPVLNTLGTHYGWKEGFYVDSTVQILYIPENREDFSNYEKYSLSQLKEGTKIVEAYRVGNESYDPTIILYYAGDGVQKNDSVTVTNRTDRISGDARIVTKIQSVLNSYDEAVYELTMFGVNGEEKLRTETAELIDNVISVSKGDIIRYGTNGKGEIIGITIYAGNDTLKATKGYNSNVASTVEFRYIYGAAWEKFGQILSIVADDVSASVSSDAGYNFKMDTNKIVVYDAKDGTAQKGSIADVVDYVQSGGKDYSRIFVQTSYGVSDIIIVVNNL